MATVDLILPPVCAGCFVPLESTGLEPGLCAGCRADLLAERLQDACGYCGVPRPPGTDPEQRCPSCRRRRFAFQQVIALGGYRGAVRRAVIRMKQFHEFPLTAAIGALLADELGLQLRHNRPQIVVPVPKYWLRRWLHGSSAAELLAEVVGRRLRLTVAGRALGWQRRTRKQSLLPLGQRQRNLHGALRLRRGHDLRGAHVLVLDDTMTTGATAGEAARVLRQAGARRVTIGVIGRAVVDRLPRKPR